MRGARTLRPAGRTHPAAIACPESSTPQELYRLYASDKLVLHSVPVSKVPDRPPLLKDETSLVCGSLLFHDGLLNRRTQQRLPNAVARFGEQDKVLETVFGTLHDLDKIWETHERFEQQKQEDTRGEPFVFFTDCDMCEIAKAKGGQPWGSYVDTQWQVTKPTVFQRKRDFDFRSHCENALVKDDPSKPALCCEWNELRAALSLANMVGLCYIYDPTHSPYDHVDAARELFQRLSRVATGASSDDDDAEGTAGEGVTDSELRWHMAVFELDGPGKVTGRLLTIPAAAGGEGAEGGAGAEAEGPRLVTFSEFLQGYKKRNKEEGRPSKGAAAAEPAAAAAAAAAPEPAGDDSGVGVTG